MKRIFILLVFCSGFLQAQLNPVGNILFTDIQKSKLQAGFNNIGGTFPDNTTGYHDDFAEMNARAEDFRSDMSTTGIDRGAFINFHTGRNLLPRYSGDGGIASTEDPFPASWNTDGRGPLYSHRNIHAAALKAYATDDITLAGYVFDALLSRAQDDELDPSNGGSRREAGKPARNNPTYGTNERFPFERQETFRACIKNNPYFMYSGKMEQYLISFLITYDLIKDTTNYINNGDIVTYWFEDYYRFVKFSADINTSYWFGSNWRNFQQDWARPTLGNEVASYSSPGNPLQTVSDAAKQGIQNRTSKSYLYISTFGKAFPSSTIVGDANDFTYDIYRAWLAVCIFPDGTGHEHYRWDANPDYLYTQYINFLMMAHTNEVAVERGYLPISEQGKFYEYSSSMGTDELFDGTYAFTSTSGGPKNIRLVLDGLAKYHRNAANGGYSSVRYRESGSLYTTSHNQTVLASIYLAYDETDEEIQDWFSYNSSGGYVNGLNGTFQANGLGPHTLENGFGLQNAFGGHMAFDGTNVFGSEPTEPSTETPINSNADKKRAFYRTFYNY